MDNPLWTEVAPSRFPWEREALAFLKAGLTNHEPWRAWTNFEFVAENGSINEVDALIVSPKGMFLVEAKSHPGVIKGDQQRWTWTRPDGSFQTFDNPLFAVNGKAKKLRSLLARQPVFAKARADVPFVHALVFLSADDLDCRLHDIGRTNVVCRDTVATRPAATAFKALPGVHATLKDPTVAAMRGNAVNAPLSKQGADAMRQLGIRPNTGDRRLGDWQLGELLDEGEGWQDFAPSALRPSRAAACASISRIVPTPRTTRRSCACSPSASSACSKGCTTRASPTRSISRPTSTAPRCCSTARLTSSASICGSATASTASICCSGPGSCASSPRCSTPSWRSGSWRSSDRSCGRPRRAPPTPPRSPSRTRRRRRNVTSSGRTGRSTVRQSWRAGRSPSRCSSICRGGPVEPPPTVRKPRSLRRSGQVPSLGVGLCSAPDLVRADPFPPEYRKGFGFRYTIGYMTRAMSKQTGIKACPVILYVRVSTEEQAISGLSIEDQTAKLSAMAAFKAWTDTELIIDDGHSAKSLNRPGIARALLMLEHGLACAIAVTKLDRLSRSVHDFGGLLKAADTQGWSLAVADMDIDTSRPNGKLVANVLMAMAEWERESIGERTKDALAAKRARGERVGRRPASDAVRARVLDLRRSGLTQQAVADALNAEGVPTVKGGPWRVSSVQSVLQSLAVDHELSLAAAQR